MKHREEWTWRRAAAWSIAVATLALVGPLVPAASAVPSSLWETNGQVEEVVESGGTVYLGGQFSYLGPHTGSGVALSSESGAVDSRFPHVDGGKVTAVVADGTGGWFIGGEFTSVGGVARRHLAHIAADGTLDSVWNPPTVNGSVFALAVSGSIVFVAESSRGSAGKPAAGSQRWMLRPVR